MHAGTGAARSRVEHMVLPLARVEKETFVVARRSHHAGARHRHHAQQAFGRTRVAQPHTPGPALPQPVGQHIATAVDQGVLDTLRVQHLHACFEDRELGDPAQVQRHALAHQKGRARPRVEHQAPGIHQRPLARQLGRSRHQLVAVRAKVPRFEGAHGHIKSAPAQGRDALCTLQHGHDFGRHGHGRDARRQMNAADHTLRLVAAHQRLQPLHLGIGPVHRMAQQRAIGALGHDVHLRAHQRPRGAAGLQAPTRCSCPGVPEHAAQQRQHHGHAAA